MRILSSGYRRAQMNWFRRKGFFLGGQSHRSFLGTEPRPHNHGRGGRKLLKNIRLFKVEVSSAKLLAMVEMVEWIGVWKITKWNNNVLILKITPGPTPTFWKEKKKAVKYGLNNRICNFAYFHGAWDWRSYYSWIQPPSGWHVYIIKQPIPHCGVTGQMGETSDWPKWRGAHSY